MDVRAFEQLVNPKGLVVMRVTDSFAPYFEGDLAGFPPEEAARLFKLKAAEPVDEKGQVIDLSGDVIEVRREPARSSAVAIPENWESLHHLQRLRIAKELTGQQPATVEEADSVIRAELQRRGEQ